jgi:hypothetical protein
MKGDRPAQSQPTAGTVANGVLTVYIEYAVDGNVEVKG